MNTKVVFSPFHFFAGNTPKTIESIGNISLILATIGAMILGLPATLAASGLVITLPSAVLVSAKVMVAVSVMIKTITKCFGVIDAGTGEKVSTTTLIAPEAKIIPVV